MLILRIKILLTKIFVSENGNKLFQFTKLPSLFTYIQNQKFIPKILNLLETTTIHNRDSSYFVYSKKYIHNVKFESFDSSKFYEFFDLQRKHEFKTITKVSHPKRVQ